jgi:hypothetical protein
MTIHNIPNKPSLISTLTGLIPNEIISTINEITLSHKIASTLTIKFLLHLNQQIHKQIWIPYCTSRHQTQVSTPLPQIDSNIQFNTIPSTSHTMANTITKLDNWYPLWIKYQTPLLNIITNLLI